MPLVVQALLLGSRLLFAEAVSCSDAPAQSLRRRPRSLLRRHVREKGVDRRHVGREDGRSRDGRLERGETSNVGRIAPSVSRTPALVLTSGDARPQALAHTYVRDGLGGPISAKLGPNLANFGRFPPNVADIRLLRPEFGGISAISADGGPNLAKSRHESRAQPKI